MTLGIRKLIVIGLILLIVCVANIMVIAAWLQGTGVIKLAHEARQEFLTGTAITIIVALLILLVGRSNGAGQWIGRRCRVCDRRMGHNDEYCSSCGSKA